MKRSILSSLLVCVLAAEARAAGDIVIADFEGKDYGAWTVIGTAFGAGPMQPGAEQRKRFGGYGGHGLAASWNGGDSAVGTLTSPSFTIRRKFINFLIGGGNWPGLTCAELFVDGVPVRSSCGSDDDRMQWTTWDVAAFSGKTASLRIVDKQTSLFGHVLADEFTQNDKPRSDLIVGDDTAGRRQALAALEKFGVDDIVFAERREDADGHWYANFGYWSNNPNRTLYHEGGKLCRLNLKTGRVTTLLDDPTGGVRDPQLFYDARKMIFSYRKGGQPFYHLYEINLDGSGLRQLTDGSFDDIEPAYLPDGGIVFCSSRCKRMVNCWFVRVAVLHRCDADGGNIRELSANIEQDNTPWVLPDGRVVYQRLEYVDRSRVSYHHLWTMNPDGTGQMVYFGNQRPGTVMIDAKPISGTGKVVASFSPGHGKREHAGIITVVTPSLGPDDERATRSLGKGRFYRDPFPLSEDWFVVAGSTDILALNGDGSAARLYDLPAADKLAGLRLHEPRPVLRRPRERVIPSRVNASQPTGELFLADIYHGRNMAGVRRGQIKKLLVLEALPKPVNFSGTMEPLTYGGSFTLERILGTVPVEPDGSARFEVPASRSLFLVALDEHDMAVKRMQSFLSVQPGEKSSCTGCHEYRQDAPSAKGAVATAARVASRIEPIAGVPDVFDFPRDIQPILDRHCVACHNYDATAQGGPRAGGVILTGDRGPWYSHSYTTLTALGEFSDGRDLAKSNYAPWTLGSAASPLLKKLAGTHHGTVLSAHEQAMLRLWIDAAAPYPGTYAALGSGMVAGDGWGKDTTAVLERRCAKCHHDNLRLPLSPGEDRDFRRRKRAAIALDFSPHTLFNLTRPEKSLLLLAPLTQRAGGYAGAGKHEAVFASTDDPDYQVLLKAMRATGQRLETVKRFDMPGFRPNEHYIREMKFYGVLPQDLAPDAAINPYATDQAYWRSLWYNPEVPRSPKVSTLR